MKRIITLALIALLAVPAPAWSQSPRTELAQPAPDYDHPRRIMLQLSSGDERKINDVLWNAVNLQKFYGIDNVRVAIIVFGPGMVALYKNSSPVRERVESLLKYEIAFVGCGNTMSATDRRPEELIDGVTYVEAAIAEIVERQLAGWTYIHP